MTSHTRERPNPGTTSRNSDMSPSGQRPGQRRALGVSQVPSNTTTRLAYAPPPESCVHSSPLYFTLLCMAQAREKCWRVSGVASVGLAKFDQYLALFAPCQA